MVIYMSDKKIETLDDIRAFLKGTVEVEFSIADKGECCLSRLFREILYLWFSGPFIDWNRLPVRIGIINVLFQQTTMYRDGAE